MLLRCRSPIWVVDDFSDCFEHDYLQTLIPLTLGGISLLVLLVQLFRQALQSKSSLAYHLLGNRRTFLGIPLPASWQPISQDDLDETASQTTDIDDEIERNAELALHPSLSQAQRLTTVEADRPWGESLLVGVEVVATLAELVLHAVALADRAWGKHGDVAAVSGVVFWGYVFLLVGARLLLSAIESTSFTFIWYHTAALYSFAWLDYVFLFRSALIRPRSSTSRSLMIAEFSLLSLLTAIALTTRKGNKVVHLVWEGEIEPSREQTASLFSLATYAWVDRIVWTGYTKTYELADVWNLLPTDKAAYVLAQYRQVKKSSSLAWHLMYCFRGRFLVQAGWACFSGVLTFTPTLLLKAILEYVEDPDSTPRNAVWLWVMLLFVSGCCSALADGAALWNGRRTCLRLEAIVMGELYAKALRRKAGAMGDKVLGEAYADDDSKPTILQRLFGKKKKKSDEDEEIPAAATTDEDNSGSVSSGAIINLMAVDSFKIGELAAYLHFLWATTPVQLVICIVLLWQVMGPSSIGGIAMIIFLLPINMYIAKSFAKIEAKILAATDARIDTTNEVFTNIRIIKYFAWEQRFINKIDEKRTLELKRLRSKYVLWATGFTVWSAAPILITFVSFASYTLIEKKRLIPSVAFTALSLFQILRIPLDQLADMIAHVQDAKVSVDRVEEFLSEEDTGKYQQLKHRDEDDVTGVIGFDHATFSWAPSTRASAESDAFKMMDLDMRFETGQLNVIAGPTGSGKTSLLMAILGEMTLLEGRVYLSQPGSREDLRRDPATGLTESVAYCAQQAWLVNDTLKQNIVFASPWDEKRYNAVITACSLRKDLEILDDGDDTLVGEKGVSLSGGQKQRVSLARALYSSARHLLLDDILSAVDSHTAKWIFEKALNGPLMHERTCILVTHNVTLCLPHAQFAVVLDNGRVAAQGTAAQIIASGTLGDDFTKSTATSRAPSRIPSANPSDDEDESDLTKVPTITNGSLSKVKKNDPTGEAIASAPAPGKAAPVETKATGSVRMEIIFMYIRSMGGWIFWGSAGMLFIAHQVASVSTNVWIRNWANAYEYDESAVLHSSSALHVHGGNAWPSFSANTLFTWNSTTRPEPRHPPVNAVYYLGMYAALGAVFISITFTREFLLLTGSLTASKILHSRLIKAISRAKFRFFDSTPLGQLMNRFSKDLENLDQEVAPIAIGYVHCFVTIVTIVILISVITPGFLIAGFFISIFYFLIGKFYINSSRDLKRLESVQRSPLYQQFGETLAGMITIRAYGDERRFIRDNLKRVNDHNRPDIYMWAANRWLAFRVDVAGACVSFFAGVFVVLSVGTIDAGSAGLALTYAVTFTENVLWFVRLYANNEQNMNSVERLKEYIDVEQEAPAIVEDRRPAANWPSEGGVEFVNYSTRYRDDLGLVLNELSFKIAPGEKVGIVGRTGAGKSSLAYALFRALEAEGGQIFVDGVDISTIGLQDLRENIVMVPQDPTLFSGTIRSNLDPFELFTDEEIFTVLRRVQLISSTSTAPTPSRPATPLLVLPKDATKDKDTLRTRLANVSDSPTTSLAPTQVPTENKNIFRNLSSAVAESGSNLSQGQRQLLCLARALLKNPKVLLMDEATASIDYATDAKIQETIRETKGGTIITIAHRLRTVIDYDKVLVLERGRLVEWGSPWELLRPDAANDSDSSTATGAADGSTNGVDGATATESTGHVRWFRGMCEMSGELEMLEEEARRSWERSREGST